MRPLELMALFRSLGSIHILSLLGFTTVTIFDTQSVATLTGARMFSSTILSNLSLSGSLRVTGTWRGGCITGCAVWSISIYNKVSI